VISPVSGAESVAGLLQARLAPMAAPMSALSEPGAAVTASAAATGGANASTAGFSTLLSRAVGGLQDQVATADRLQELAATGQLADPTEAIVATQQADLSLRLAVQVRNRLVEGWQELSRMGV
jgi:flagellar hook-basal body complex protein FliE